MQAVRAGPNTVAACALRWSACAERFELLRGIGRVAVYRDPHAVLHTSGHARDNTSGYEISLRAAASQVAGSRKVASSFECNPLACSWVKRVSEHVSSRYRSTGWPVEWHRQPVLGSLLG